MSIAIALHMLAALVWVGGMFFAWVVLRPVAASGLEPASRLTLWNGVFARFFPWVWAAVVALPVSGYWIIFTRFGGMENVGIYVHAMNGLGYLMIALFLFLFFVPYRGLKAAVAVADWGTGARHLGMIRRIVGINLLLGLAAATLGSAGSYFLN